MNLSKSKIVAFIPSIDLLASKSFYEQKLGLSLRNADDFALEYDISGMKLRVTKVPEITPANYTVFGWEVKDIDTTVTHLLANGIQFVRYQELSQDELKICTFPGGSKVAWFKDPDGNTLSITQFAG
ncbi:MAG: VOC family protein [Gammaproteobacteria bacterium]|jgi:predicted enzyme related to lactoylglutathione lyase|nr:VOC family protein [Gammaproteobacteria bacterium]